MIKFYVFIENRWFKIPQKIRFLLVGGFNTLLAYLLFIGFVQGLKISYRLSLIMQYFMTINLSIFTMRYYVFQSRNKLQEEYRRAWNVYLFMLAFNYIFLYLLVNLGNLNVILSQGIYIIISTIITFLFHKHYSFCR